MPLEFAFILPAIVLAFTGFALALAWGDRQTRGPANKRT